MLVHIRIVWNGNCLLARIFNNHEKKCKIYIMANIAIFIPGVGDLVGGGGAERFFFDFFQKYQHINSKNKLYFITDRVSLENFKLLNEFSNSKRLISYHLFNNRFKDSLEFYQILRILIKHRIHILQIPLYNLHFYNLIKRVDSLPKFIRPKIVFNITDCRIPYYYFEGEKHGHNYKKTFEPVFKNIQIDAVVSWYELFKTFALLFKYPTYMVFYSTLF